MNNEITFVLSVYNTKKEWLTRSINSIFSQTDSRWKLIIVDDGSSMDVAVYLDQIKDNHSSVTVYHQTNQGLSVARNKGMDNTNTKWITFIDSDDWIEDHYVEDLLRILSEKPDLEMLSFGHEDVWPNKTISHIFGSKDIYSFDETGKDLMLLALFQQSEGLNAFPMFFGAQWKFVYSTEFINKYLIRNIPGLYKAQDSVFNMYATHYAKKIGYYNKVLYHYFHNELSVTACGFNRDLGRFQRLVAEYIRFLKNTDRYSILVYKRALVNNALLQFESMLDRYFLHKNNKDPLRIRKEKMYALLKNQPYLGIVQERIDGLSMYKKIFMKVIKTTNYGFITRFYAIKKIIYKLVKKN